MTKTKAPPAPVIGQREQALLDRKARAAEALSAARQRLALAEADANRLIGDALVVGGNAEAAEHARERMRREQENVRALELYPAEIDAELPEARRRDEQEAAAWRAWAANVPRDHAAQRKVQDLAEQLGRAIREWADVRTLTANPPAALGAMSRPATLVLQGSIATPNSAAVADLRTCIAGVLFDESRGLTPPPHPDFASPGLWRRMRGTIPESQRNLFWMIAAEHDAPADVVEAVKPPEAVADRAEQEAA
jgi:hypothetical protein